MVTLRMVTLRRVTLRRVTLSNFSKSWLAIETAQVDYGLIIDGFMPLI